MYFSGQVIRLNEKDGKAWEKRFANVDLYFLLCQRDQDLAIENLTNWFWSTQKWLEKINNDSNRESF